MVFKSGFFTPFLRQDMTFSEYQSLFRDEHGIVNVESDEHLTLPGIHPHLGVRTTSLAQVEEVADLIRKHLPDVRILMVVRNQASLIAARYSEYLIRGGSLVFEEFVDHLAGRKRPLPELLLEDRRHFRKPLSAGSCPCAPARGHAQKSRTDASSDRRIARTRCAGASKKGHAQ
jgi:hypothetical protein